MEEIAHSMAEAGLPDGFHQAAAEIYRRCPRLPDAAAGDEILTKVLAAITAVVPPARAALRSGQAVGSNRGAFVMTMTQMPDMTDCLARCPLAAMAAHHHPGDRRPAAVGAFLMWGPIGLGNGPLDVEMGGIRRLGRCRPGSGRVHPADVELRRQASRDRLSRAPRRDPVRRAARAWPRAVSTAICGGAWPARPDRHGFVLVGCGVAIGAR